VDAVNQRLQALKVGLQRQPQAGPEGGTIILATLPGGRSRQPSD
jgi:hypothetical protein